MLPSGRCFVWGVFLNKIPGFYYSILLLLEFFSPVGLVILSGSWWNGLFSSFQDCLVEGLDFGVQVLPFVVVLLRMLINQIWKTFPVGLLAVPPVKGVGSLWSILEVQADRDGFVIAASKLTQYCYGYNPWQVICSKSQIWCSTAVLKRRFVGHQDCWGEQGHCEPASILLPLLFCLLLCNPMPLSDCWSPQEWCTYCPVVAWGQETAPCQVDCIHWRFYVVVQSLC